MGHCCGDLVLTHPSLHFKPDIGLTSSVDPWFGSHVNVGDIDTLRSFSVF